MDTMELKRGRILALDILRGYFILVIIVNHLAWHTNLFEPFTGKGSLWASAAEGFFAVSGILVGYIYGPKILTNTRHTFKRIWKRALLLYLLFVATTLAFTGLAYFSGSTHIPPGLWDRGSITDLIGATLSFDYLYGLNDFLSRYAIFMAAAPFILLFLAKYGRRGGAAIVLASVTLWLLLQPLVYSTGIADILIWQIVFVPSIVIGYYLPTIEHWFTHLATKTKRLIVSLLGGLALISYLLSYIYTSYTSSGIMFWLFDKIPTLTTPLMTVVRHIGDTLQPLTDKQSLGAVAIATGMVWFWILYIVVRRYELKIHSFTRGFLAFVGKNSLTAYVIHAFVIFFFTLFVQSPSSGYVIEKTLVSTTIVLVTVGLTWLFVRFRSTQTK